MVVYVHTIKYIFSFVFSFLITFYLVPFFSSLANKIQFVDVPDGKVKQHKKPIPYMGGIAVYGGFLFSIAFTMPFENKIFLLLVGCTLLLLIGLVDDLLQLKAYQKFFGQLLVALCFLKAGFYLKEHFFYNIWNLPLSLLWILTIINAFNLVDVMDGLATSIAIFATITFACIALIFQHHLVLLLLLPFLGALCAFLYYNKPPASIYLGDAGSLFIGGFLATVPFLFDWGTYNWYGYLTPIIILAIPLLECASLIIIRMYKNIPFYNASPDHFCLYLQSAGWSKEGILKYIGFMASIIGTVSLLFVSGKLSITTIFFVGGLFLLIWTLILWS